MKVLFFLAEYGAGVTSLFAGQAMALSKSRRTTYEFIVGSSEKETGLCAELAAGGLTIHEVPSLEFHSNFRRQLRVFCSICAKTKPDVIHVQTNWQFMLVVVAKVFWRFSYKISYTIHAFRHNEPRKAVLAKYLIGSMLKIFASRVLVCSAYTYKEFRFLHDKMEKIFLGVDKCFFELAASNKERKNEKLRIGFVGEFRQGKNHDLIIRALTVALSRSGRSDVELCFVGSGALEGEIRELAATRLPPHTTTFLGFLPKVEVRNFLMTIDVAVIPTNAETFGLCIAESFTTGCCVVSRRVGIAEELLTDGENGFLFDTESELSDILTRLLREPETIRRCSNAASAQGQLFNWENLVDAYDEFYLKAKSRPSIA